MTGHLWKGSKMALVRTLLDCDQEQAQPGLSSGLRDLYDGDLVFPPLVDSRLFVIANFVSTLDGVVSYEIEGQAGGSTISGFDPTDRFIMGLLRASADAVIVGARTVQDVSPESLWTPEYTYPDARHLYAEYRVALHKPEYPLLVIVSGSGRLELERAIFRTPGHLPIIFNLTFLKDHQNLPMPYTYLFSFQAGGVSAAFFDGTLRSVVHLFGFVRLFAGTRIVVNRWKGLGPAHLSGRILW